MKTEHEHDSNTSLVKSEDLKGTDHTGSSENVITGISLADIADVIIAVDKGDYQASISRSRQAGEFGLSVCIFLFL